MAQNESDLRPGITEPAARGTLRDYGLSAVLILETLILFVAAPLAAIGIRAPLFIGGLLGMPLLLAIVIISARPGAIKLATIATVLGVGGVMVRLDHPSLITVWLGHSAVIMALLAISLVIGRAVFAPGRITHHRIQGAIILYFNIAVVFTSIYRLITELDPDALSNLPPHGSETAAVSGILYFSFTTLTSTGFGEILPINPFARSMANLEAILGQMYIAILLARIVTMQLDSRRN